jgi:hypothetical protein
MFDEKAPSSDWRSLPVTDSVFAAGQGFTSDGLVVVVGGSPGKNLTIGGKVCMWAGQ